ncbi:MAG TPA: cyclic nucleotide-binding domain-containing protein, partial [Roseimicrobium sp.]|nr:cyclic nucleotide-binding domain-containing protein [Roseimicrobium sp.]
RLLHREGGGLHLLKLQGFIFFGTANTLLHSIRTRAEDAGQPALKCVILDFRRVSGLDSSAALSLVKAGRLGRKSGFSLLLTQVPDNMQNQLHRGFVDVEISGGVKFFADLDHALEWWESQVLDQNGMTGQDDGSTLRDQLLLYWPDSVTLDGFLSRLQRTVLEENQHLIRQGDVANQLFFIESGEVSTVLESNDGSPARRLRRQSGGTVLGELGLLLKLPRSASVIVNRRVVVYQLSAESLVEMKRQQPEVTADFYEFLSKYLSERVLTTTQSLRVMTE